MRHWFLPCALSIGAIEVTIKQTGRFSVSIPHSIRPFFLFSCIFVLYPFLTWRTLNGVALIQAGSCGEISHPINSLNNTSIGSRPYSRYSKRVHLRPLLLPYSSFPSITESGHAYSTLPQIQSYSLLSISAISLYIRSFLEFMPCVVNGYV